MVFGLSRVDFGGASSSGSAGATSAPVKESLGSGSAGGGFAVPSTSTTPKRLAYGADRGAQFALKPQHALTASLAPRPLRAAILGRLHLAAPIRKTFGAIDPHQTAPRP
jgi:hypothetical protein